MMIMAGGTGGHVFPALAVAETLRDNNVRVVWLGTQTGIEADLVPKARFDIEWINIKGLRKSGLARKLMLPVTLLRAVWQSTLAIKKQKPDALLGMGGFVSGPGGLAAWLLRKPILIHEQNAIAGLTNSYLSKLARYVMSGFPNTFAANKSLWVGNPVRKEIRELPAPQTRLKNQRGDRDDDGALRVLVIGGSQGAQVFNQTLPALFAECANDVSLVVKHQCGKGNLEKVSQLYDEQNLSTIEVSEFISDMASAYAWCDVVVCRAGAMTVAEVTAAGVCALFVPYPHAVSDHQTANARFVVDAEAGFLIPQAQLDSQHIKPVLLALASNRERLLQLSQAARGLAKPDATEQVTEKCMEVLNA